MIASGGYTPPNAPIVGSKKVKIKIGKADCSDLTNHVFISSVVIGLEYKKTFAENQQTIWQFLLAADLMNQYSAKNSCYIRST